MDLISSSIYNVLLCSDVNNPYSARYIQEVLSLLTDALRRSPTMQEDFYHLDGYKVVASFLRHIDTSYITKDVIGSVIALVQASQGIRGRQERPLYNSGVNDCLFDFRLWRALPGDLLSFVTSSCSEIVRLDPLFMKDYILDVPVSKLSICLYTDMLTSIALRDRNPTHTSLFITYTLCD